MMTASGKLAGLYVSETHVALALRTGAREPRVVERVVSSPMAIVPEVKALLADQRDLTDIIVVVARPLAHLRIVNLPSMPREMAERVLARDADRYVIGNGAYVVSARPLDAGRWVAAFAPADLLAQIDDAASRVAGNVRFATVDDVLATSAHGGTTRDDRFVVVSDANGPSVTAHIRNGMAIGGRQFLAGATPDDIRSFARERGAPNAPTTTVAEGSTTASVLASLASVSSPALSLRAAGENLRSRRRDDRVTGWLLIGAAAAVLLAFALEQTIVAARLHRVTEQRATIASQVSRVLRLRDSVLTQAEFVSAIADREGHASRSGGVLAAIALALPRNATLSTVQLVGDSVLVEGESRDGAAVYDALKRVRELERVTLAAPLRRERTQPDAGNTMGHFAFAAYVRRVPR
ncbi:MAG: hypothetical protein ABI969_01120 [bacterium]